MTAAEWTMPEPSLLLAFRRLFGDVPATPLLPEERRTHEAAFEVVPPEPEPADVPTLERRYERHLDRMGGSL